MWNPRRRSYVSPCCESLSSPWEMMFLVTCALSLSLSPSPQSGLKCFPRPLHGWAFYGSHPSSLDCVSIAHGWRIDSANKKASDVVVAWPARGWLSEGLGIQSKDRDGLVVDNGWQISLHFSHGTAAIWSVDVFLIYKEIIYWPWEGSVLLSLAYMRHNMVTIDRQRPASYIIKPCRASQFFFS